MEEPPTTFALPSSETVKASPEWAEELKTAAEGMLAAGEMMLAAVRALEGEGSDGA